MLGTIVNSLAIVVGGLTGFFFKNIIPARLSDSMLKASAMAVLLVGIKLSLVGENLTLLIVSLILGTLIGELVNIEGKLDKLGKFVESKFKNKDSNITQGFVSCTLIYCVGSMAIVGSIQSGLTGNHEILFSKAVLDGIISITMAVTMGIGVVLSSVSVFIYQGSITMLAQFLQSVLSDVVVSEMTAIGGVLIMAIALNFLEIKRIKVGNMIPAVFIPIIYFMIFK
ncbi:putative membrane protein YqgA involved in biofilm formation [Sedimentibacter acidaminivorans]|uniref:Membrane protein YqgA involved in biofilm formation n=1 Tax=Sedimentibacter acidaminivorans TaxID=913099 RepID=A0ABS4GA46_9FIRM|nr:DUF554 domain-containing protein [Sedimentibacter acidaminivorans]MBP1924546.1 putative membrane protein YqgA involved in biofilm formation [Sedimentibacter acidaminivorans]